MLPGLIKIGEEQPKDTLKPLIEVAKEVYRVLTKTNRLVKEKLWRIPPAEHLRSGGDVFFMYTCLDYTLMTGYLLKRLGIPSCLIMNELTGKGLKIHFGMETPLGFIDHLTGNNVVIGNGELPNFYEQLNQERQTMRHYIDLSPTNGSETIFDIIKRNKIKISFFSEGTITEFSNKFERINTPAVWRNFVQQCRGDVKNPTIYLQE